MSGVLLIPNQLWSMLLVAVDIFRIPDRVHKIFNRTRFFTKLEFFIISTKNYAFWTLSLHQLITDCLGIPWVISTSLRRHVTQVFVGFGSIGTPHWQQRICPTVPLTGLIYSILKFLNIISPFKITEFFSKSTKNISIVSLTFNNFRRVDNTFRTIVPPLGWVIMLDLKK